MTSYFIKNIVIIIETNFIVHKNLEAKNKLSILKNLKQKIRILNTESTQAEHYKSEIEHIIIIKIYNLIL